MKLIDMQVTGYLDILASDAPAPGGGSAAALCGAQGIGLVTMVAGQTAIKKAYVAIETNADNKAEAVSLAVKKIDQAASKGIMHKNKASRSKANLAKRLNASA